MPLPRPVARFTARVINPLTRLFAGVLPGFAIVTHAGRHSGQAYRTPINVFRWKDRYVVALTYGAKADWVKNVLAADGCVLETRGTTVPVADPHLVVDPSRQLVPAPVRALLALLDVNEFMTLRAATPADRS